jgi:hypothetical protein
MQQLFSAMSDGPPGAVDTLDLIAQCTIVADAETVLLQLEAPNSMCNALPKQGLQPVHSQRQLPSAASPPPALLVLPHALARRQRGKALLTNEHSAVIRAETQRAVAVPKISSKSKPLSSAN